MKSEQQAEARIKNFTPLLDELVQKYGIITAAVWGRVWRYAQQDNHVCTAAQDKIASELNISLRTVTRHLATLLDAGYLEDKTPDLKNHPHTYAITRKARILITVDAVTESHSTMSESQSAMSESHSEYVRKSHEETIKETNKKQDPTEIFLQAWKELFPEKPQPKPETIREKLKTRMKCKDFATGWRAALETGAKTRVLHKEKWFNLTFFLRNDENFQKVQDGWMDWKDEESRPRGSSAAVIQPAPAQQDNGKGMYL